MDDICRLCCSTNFVNNYIFDEENALYLKMSLYLPIKVFKNDRLPQRVCDKCSCKVNDFYQFCNETIEVQQRLRAVLISSGLDIQDSIDLTLIKHNDLSPAPAFTDGFVQKVEPPEHNGAQNFHPVDSDTYSQAQVNSCSSKHKHVCDQSTQTDEVDVTKVCGNNVSEQWPQPVLPGVQVKEEPQQSPCKLEQEDYYPGPDELDEADRAAMADPAYSDCSDDNLTLSTIKRERKKRKKQAAGRPRKKKPKLKQLVDSAVAPGPPQAGGDGSDGGDTAGTGTVKQEPGGGGGEYQCCICFQHCYSRSEMLQHYKAHLSAAVAARGAPPSPPAAPPVDPVSCSRCLKSLPAAEWGAHWLRHWHRDARPLRCALCERAFRCHQQALRHGLQHSAAAGAAAAVAAAAEGSRAAATQQPPKRFLCDVCGAAFVFLRCVRAHRMAEHPAHAHRPLALRCAICQRAFAHLNSLRRHLRAHSGERNFLCSVCGKALSSREHLKFHLRIHTGFKPNVCKTCGKGFVKKCNLTLHERVHSGEKPHVCSACGKAFSQRSTLVIHERYHSGARPYVCALCGRGFVAKGLLSMHLKTTCI